MYAIELYFDPETERLIRKIAQEIITKHIPDFRTAIRPHISLGVANEIDQTNLTTALENFARDLPEFPLSLSYFGIFAVPEVVLYLGATVTTALFQAHRTFFAFFPNGASKLNPYYLPDSWVPHCTLVDKLSPETAIGSLSDLIATPLPIRGRLASVGLERVAPLPSESLAEFPLRGKHRLQSPA
jgi:2'-5' RNA ligase